MSNQDCPACKGTGSCDSGGETPWGARIEVRCECTYPDQPTPTGQQVAGKPKEHRQSQDCWCSPTLDFVDPETGNSVWVHHEPN